MATFSPIIHVVQGSQRLLKATLAVSTAWTLSGTNYWTVKLKRKRVGHTDGEVVGTYDFSARNVSANTEVSLYSSPVGLAMTDGEQIVAEFVSTGTPADLTAPVVTLDIQESKR